MLFEFLKAGCDGSRVNVLKRCLSGIFEFDGLLELLMVKKMSGMEDVLLLCLYRLVNAPGQEDLPTSFCPLLLGSTPIGCCGLL